MESFADMDKAHLGKFHWWDHETERRQLQNLNVIIGYCGGFQTCIACPVCFGQTGSFGICVPRPNLGAVDFKINSIPEQLKSSPGCCSAKIPVLN